MGVVGGSVFFHLIPETAKYYVLYVFLFIYFISAYVFCIAQPWVSRFGGFFVLIYAPPPLPIQSPCPTAEEWWWSWWKGGQERRAQL